MKDTKPTTKVFNVSNLFLTSPDKLNFATKKKVESGKPVFWFQKLVAQKRDFVEPTQALRLNHVPGTPLHRLLAQ